MTVGTCPGCDDPGLRAIAEALAVDDLDRALALGLLDVALPDVALQNIATPGAAMSGAVSSCPDCAVRMATIVEARTARLTALDARERHRRRAARLQARAQRQAEKRRGMHGNREPVASSAVVALPAPGDDTRIDTMLPPPEATPVRPALPAAAAAALARAKARVAARRD